MLGITIITMVSNIFGGSPLVYLVSRTPFFKLFLPATVWSIISSVAFTFFLSRFHLIPSNRSIDILILSLLSSLFSANVCLLLGNEKIKEQNIANFIQVALLALALSIEIYSGNRDISAYISSLYVSYGVSFLLTIFYLRKEIKISPLDNLSPVLKQVIKFGFYVQFATLVQTLNYRFSFYILDHDFGKSPVGIYSVVVAFADACWLIARSISLVQYARIANSDNAHYSRLLTVNLAKVSFAATALAILILIVLPKSFYELVFGNSFGQVRDLLLITAPGIVFFGFSMIMSHYFSGIGKYYVNTIASSVGFIVTAALCYLLIPLYEAKGAALAACLSYFASGGIVVYLFLRETKFSIKNLVPSITDFTFFREQLKSFMR
jgi:O-antigen/teichoic acid export membrane protein